MAFTHNGEKYSLSFRREYPMVRRFVPSMGDVQNVPATKPSTTVTLYKFNNAGERSLVRTATVGCWHKDHFSLESGRIRAMRVISMTLDKELKGAMWRAYMNRTKRNKKS